jgi:MFS family permease
MLTDVSSEMLYPLIPLFLTETLGAPVAIAGLIEGFAEMTAAVMRGWSGAWSDRIGLRKPLAVAGYSISAFAKLLLGIAGSWTVVLSARVLDRFGKGIRSTARDAMLAESSTPETRGRAFGFHRSMDQLGAVIGPLLALPLIAFFQHDYRKLFLIGFLPAVAGVLVLLLASETGTGIRRQTRARESWNRLPPAFRRYLAISALFSLGNSADALLLLRARNLGVSESWVIGLFAAFNAVTVLSAWPAGIWSDKVGRQTLVRLGWALFAAAYLLFGLASEWWVLIVAFTIYGIYSGAAEGAVRAYSVDLVAPELKATALGWHGLITGCMALAANAIAGVLWSRLNPAAPFVFGALCAALAACWITSGRPLAAHRP